MPVKFVKGDIFESKARIICNAVNCIGVSGAGLALAFKNRFPTMYQDYVQYCTEKKLSPGGIHVFKLNELLSPGETVGRHIFNVATKDHWMTDSKYEWIVDGLKNIAIEAEKLGVKTVAVPALGCGLGGLEFKRVKIIIEDIAAEYWQKIDVEVYEPL